MKAGWPGHRIIMGRTGSGKTHYAIHELIPAAVRGGRAVLYWNGGHEPAEAFSAGYCLADGASPVGGIKRALLSRPVIYTPDISQATANAELAYWQEAFMRGERRPLTWMIDEAPRYAPQGSIDTPLHLLATGGRRWGIACYFICQRIADLSKTLATQAHEWIVFAHSPIDAAYLRERGIELSAAEQAQLAMPYAHLSRRA